MNALIDWQKYPLVDVFEILRRDLKVDGEIVPRALKSDDEKFSRSDAEVFTPANVVKFMVDALELEKLFWQALVDCRCLEVACGEAPFVTTRYDAESGEFVPLNRRVGILDRKFQSIAADKNFWATRAVQSVYGYELQADSLLIARANVLLSFVEFVEKVSAAELCEVAEIVAKNFWLMDGQKIPDAQGSLFATNDIRITDWLTGEEKFFTGGHAMKFDFLISNPPYQDDTPGGNKNFASPIYHEFMEAAFKAADKVMLITPARFLFDAGATPKDFNRRMLDDPHLKVVHYEPNAGKLFRNAVDIEGGIAVTFHDKTQTFGAIGTFIPWDELRSIHQKVCVDNPNFKPFSEIVSGRTPYLFTDKLHKDFPNAKTKLSDGHACDISSNVFEALPEIFFDSPNDDYCQVLGLFGRKRTHRWIKREYVCGRVDCFVDNWKIFLPKANGASGKLVDNEAARLISTPVIGEPTEIATDTFLIVGTFDTRDESEACLKFIKSKFARVMLGILKATQDNTADKWAKVPLQDFSATSDIDWRGDVDEQLYRKYGLSDDEINFIESHVKEMP